VTIVMGLDQHRAQITFDLLDTETGEVRGGRVRPADRESFRRFLRPFSGKRIEAALAATTGWRFLVEELRPVGALDGVLAGDRREHPQMRRAGSCQRARRRRLGGPAATSRLELPRQRAAATPNRS
jgi:hypothetical protein